MFHHRAACNSITQSKAKTADGHLGFAGEMAMAGSVAGMWGSRRSERTAETECGF